MASPEARCVPVTFMGIRILCKHPRLRHLVRHGCSQNGDRFHQIAQQLGNVAQQLGRELSLAKTRPEGKGSSQSKCTSLGGIHTAAAGRRGLLADGPTCRPD